MNTSVSDNSSSASLRVQRDRSPRRLMRQFVLGTSVAIALFATAMPTTISAKDRLTEVVAIHVVPDPGPPPAFNASDYDNYRKSGTSTVAGWLFNPNNLSTTCGNRYVELLPDTPFMRWILSTQARQLDGHAEDSRPQSLVYNGREISTPDFLRVPFKEGSAVRYAACDQQPTHVTFHDVPPGDYILVAYVHFWWWQSVDVVDQTPGYDGESNTATLRIDGSHSESYKVDRGGFLIWSPSSLTVEAGKDRSFTKDDLKPIARMHP